MTLERIKETTDVSVWQTFCLRIILIINENKRTRENTNQLLGWYFKKYGFIKYAYRLFRQTHINLRLDTLNHTITNNGEAKLPN
ncbi:hypothetical protein GCM10007922_17770 [Shewanella decolorationis]|nr:hypothetical protein GCM10007922_17770 [Shewanella decolorationis]